MQIMGDYPGIPGLFVAGVFSGALSTVSSGLNALAGVCLTDCLQLGCGIEISEEKKTLATKLLALIFGILSFGLVFMVKYLPGVLQAAIAIFGIVGGPILGAFSLGMFVPFANSIGAFTGMLFSLIFTFWMGFGQIIAKQTGNYNTTKFSPLIPSNTSVINCPTHWLLNDTSLVQTVKLSSSWSVWCFKLVVWHNLIYFMSSGWDHLQLQQASRSQAAGCQTDISRVSHFLLLDAKDNEVLQ